MSHIRKGVSSLELIKDATQKQFDTSMVAKGDLIYVEDRATGCRWSGIVLYVSPDRITILYLPGIANVTNRKDLFAAEVGSGNYVIRISPDMSSIESYGDEEVGNDT